MKHVLFSCVGTTDPVRGCRDGGLLHIMRYYRPEAVCVFMTPEIVRMDQNDKRYDCMMSFVKKHWGGYEPILKRVQTNIDDVSDMDKLDAPLTRAFEEFRNEHPDAEILINLTSGTPQMQMILSQLALDIRYKARGIQVKNFERGAGTTGRTNHPNYDAETELELAEMEETAKAEKRCVEPKMISIMRKAQRDRVIALLERHDYEALYAMRNTLSEKAEKVVEHLYMRSNLNSDARSSAAQLKLDFELYPAKKIDGIYQSVVEYALVTQNMQATGRLTDFILRLNPLIVCIQEALLDTLLQEQYGVSMKDIKTSDKKKLSADKIERKVPKIYDKLNTEFSYAFDDKEPSTTVYDIMLEKLDNVPQHAKELFAAYESIRNIRNSAAHSLSSYTEEDFQNAAKISSAKMVQLIQQAIIEVFPACDPAIFNVYKKCEDYIRNEC